ncbi:hypothetical protein [Pseudomonas aeruginosa]|uniref:hypothetical protein n=1 Tax=Pseudomonas aeruginosa TaxID=287 RepID=UPI0011BED9E2|nr:hypothetical protein [Pseudomonas aeruginosa]
MTLASGVLKVNGPVLEGEYIPNSGPNIPVRGIHGGVTAGARTIAGGAVSALRGGIVGVAATAAMSMALDSIGGFIDENGKPVKKVSDAPSGAVAGVYYVRPPQNVGGVYLDLKHGLTRQQACEYEVTQSGNCVIRINGIVGSSVIYANSCDPGVWFNVSTGKCDSLWKPDEHIEPLTGPDYDGITDTLSGVTNPDWLKSLLEASCEGSLSPGRCYDELTSLADQLKGPSSVKGPSSSTTSTYTRPDGTTGTTNTTTETNYTINCGPNYFDYSKTTTTTTSKDGEKPTTTTETESPEVTGEEPATEPESQTPSPCTTNCEGPAYEDQYKPTEETKESVIDNYLSRVEQAPIVNAATGFFDVSVSASCPTWQTPVDMSIMGASFHSELVFDHHCQPWFTGYRTAAMAVVMILCAFGAFYIAMLD